MKNSKAHAYEYTYLKKLLIWTICLRGHGSGDDYIHFLLFKEKKNHFCLIQVMLGITLFIFIGLQNDHIWARWPKNTVDQTQEL